MERVKKAKFVSFANLKGGAGKSSLTIQTANWLGVNTDKSVLIVDCDIAQLTCYKGFQLTDNPVYDVLPFDPSSSREEWKRLLESVYAYDYVFFDIPGTIFQEDIASLLSILDAIIVITMHSDKDLISTRSFIQYLRSGNITDFKVLLNRLRPYRDMEHQKALDEIADGEEGVLCRTLDVTPDFFFKNHIWDEQAAIEKQMEIGVIHKKMERYKDFFTELEEYIKR